jgi:hypothetical protein
MGKTGIIGVIPKDYSKAQFATMDKSLRDKGLSRVPGTFRMIFPHRDRTGRRRTGLDPEAPYILSIKDEATRIQKQNEIRKLRADLEEQTGLDLSPSSSYYDKLNPVKLKDGDNHFELDEPAQAIDFYWLRVHPAVASSYEAYLRGEHPAETHFYVKDTEIETTIAYSKRKQANEAIIKVDSWSLPKRRKIARLVGLPITEDTREEVVYNELDKFLKDGIVKTGPYMNADSLVIFNQFAGMDDDRIYVSDLIEQALRGNIYRYGKAGKIMEGEQTVFQSRDSMFAHFIDKKNQLDLVELEQKLAVKDLPTVLK